MKYRKLFAALLAGLMLAAAAAGCKGAETGAQSAAASETTGTAQIPSPLKEQESLEAVNSAIGCALVKPEGAEAESYCIIEGEPEIGQYMFTLNGAEYTLRAGKTQGDISGVYENGGLISEQSTAEDAEPVELAEGGCWCRWFAGEMQYSLYTPKADAQDFAAVTAAVRGQA